MTKEVDESTGGASDIPNMVEEAKSSSFDRETEENLLLETTKPDENLVPESTKHDEKLVPEITKHEDNPMENDQISQNTATSPMTRAGSEETRDLITENIEKPDEGDLLIELISKDNDGDGDDGLKNRKQKRSSSEVKRLRMSSLAPKGPTPQKHERPKYINVAPLNIPIRRRLEMVGIIWHTICIPTFVSLFFLTLSLGPFAWVGVILPYFLWWYLIDLHTPTNGKVAYRSRDWMKNFIVWDWFVDYFPIRVHKSWELEPTVSDVIIEDDVVPDDEEDLISEQSRTGVDKLFKFLGLRKRLNDDSDASSQCSLLQESLSTRRKVKRMSTGPRYIFGYHPHGVISMGVFGTFATNALRNEPYEPPLRLLKPFFHDSSKGERLFPGIGTVFPLTLTTQFIVPYYRDYILGMGLTSASAKNIKSLISNGDNSICVVVGGAQESLLNDMVAATTVPGRYGKSNLPNDSDTDSEFDPQRKIEENKEETGVKKIELVLNKRKGFVKIAIELGNVSLVPTFGFGEADIYRITKPKPGSFGEMFQSWMKRTFQFTVPFFSARGVFIYDFGFLPYRNPINVCFGRPIHIPAGLLDQYKEPETEKDEKEKDEKTSSSSLKTNKRQPSISNLFKFSKGKQPSKRKRVSVPQEILDHYHKLYIDELKRVFEENKHKYGYGDVELHIVE